MHYDTFSNLMKEFTEEELLQRAAEEKARRWERIRKRLTHVLLGLILLGGVISAVLFRSEIKVKMDQITGINEPRRTTAAENHTNAVIKTVNAEAARRAETIDQTFK